VLEDHPCCDLTTARDTWLEDEDSATDIAIDCISLGGVRRSVFYYDISSVYAYLAAERIDRLLPDADWRPILLGGLFKLNGRTSWFLSDERETRIAEIEERAKSYGLPPVSWPTALPENLLALARAATVAKQNGREVPFALAGFRAMFVHGKDPSSPDEMERLASSAGLETTEWTAAIGEQPIKDELRRTTEEAHALGVPGVPTVVLGSTVFWGDDRLEEAATAFRVP